MWVEYNKYDGGLIEWIRREIFALETIRVGFVKEVVFEFDQEQ